MKRILATLLLFLGFTSPALGAWGAVGALVNCNSVIAGTTLACVTPAAQLDSANVGVAWIALDNNCTADGQTSEVSGIADTGSNTWVKLGEYCNTSAGAANDGVTVSLWITKATGNVAATTGSYTITLANSKTSKAASFFEFSVAGGNTYQLAGSLQTLAEQATSAGSMAISGLSSAERLYLRAFASQDRTLGLVATASHTAITGAVANSGSGGGSVQIEGEYRIVTATSDTSDPTDSTGNNVYRSSVFVALDEVSETPATCHGSPSMLLGVGGC